jgi:hypothetical protein
MEEVKQDIEIRFRDGEGVFKFENIQGYQLGSGFLGVITADGTMNIYPSDLIFSATITPKE